LNIVVTGSSAGIGLAITERLLTSGHNVWGLARSDQSGLKKKHGNSFNAIMCDVSDWAALLGASGNIGKSWSHADGLITCAGIQGAMGRAVEADPLLWSATIRGNLDATYYSIRAFYPLLLKSPARAKIICFSGGGASKSRPNFSAYAAAKTAIVRLVETIAEEEKDRPVDINALAPGGINTRLTDEVIALGPLVVGKEEHDVAVKQKEGGGASLDKAIGAVEWLLSPGSDGISGRLLSAPWDPLSDLAGHRTKLSTGDIYKLRRITPEDRGLKW
jgi:NAD(P)-dependent dehydrogenase (short-subunit alcohol dehydrogenase family)